MINIIWRVKIGTLKLDRLLRESEDIPGDGKGWVLGTPHVPHLINQIKFVRLESIFLISISLARKTGVFDALDYHNF
jgi:hypothetical protein